MGSEEIAPRLVVSSAGELLTIERDGREVFRGRVSEIVEEPTASGVEWWKLEGGERLTVPMVNPARLALGVFVPARQLAEHLEVVAEEEEPYCDEVAGEETPIPTGITVNEQLWGWIRTAPAGTWHLLPADFQSRATTPLRVSFWQSASMTGVVTETAVRWSPPVALTWEWDDVDGLKSMEVRYDADDGAELAEHCLWLATSEWSMLCPVCTEQDDYGWVVSIEPAPELGEGFLSWAISVVWGPCVEHEQAAIGSIVMVSDEPWAWTGQNWVRAEGQAGTSVDAGTS